MCAISAWTGKAQGHTFRAVVAVPVSVLRQALWRGDRLNCRVRHAVQTVVKVAVTSVQHIICCDCFRPPSASALQLACRVGASRKSHDRHFDQQMSPDDVLPT